MASDVRTQEIKVFIGWSGERSQSLAQALHDWIPLVLHNVEPWLSEADIEAGERWAEVEAKELSDSNFGIICVTRENVGSPWILFEAGALAKSMQGSKVIPLLLDLEFSDITGPLAQFQAKKVEKTGISEIIHSINQTANNAVPEARAKQLFDALWQEFAKKVAAIPKEPTSAKHTRPQHEILEELVTSVRSLDSRLRELSEGITVPIRSKRMRFSTMMLDEITHTIGVRPNDPITLLIVASTVRETLPWLYELGMEAYRAAKTGTPEEAERTRAQFKRAFDFLRHFPIDEELGMDPRLLHMVTRELEHYMITEPQTEEEQRVRPKRRKEEKEST